MINLFFIIVIGAIVCCYVGNSMMEKRREEQEAYWHDFLLRMSRTGRLVDEYYHPLPESFINSLGIITERPHLKNDLDALFLTPDIVIKVIGCHIYIEHRPTFYEDTSITIS